MTGFEEFLADRHSDQYIGTDDDMPNAFDHWLSNLDVQELIDLGNEYAEGKNKLNTLLKAQIGNYKDLDLLHKQHIGYLENTIKILKEINERIK